MFRAQPPFIDTPGVSVREANGGRYENITETRHVAMRPHSSVRGRLRQVRVSRPSRARSDSVDLHGSSEGEIHGQQCSIVSSMAWDGADVPPPGIQGGEQVVPYTARLSPRRIPIGSNEEYLSGLQVPPAHKSITSRSIASSSSLENTTQNFSWITGYTFSTIKLLKRDTYSRADERNLTTFLECTQPRS